MPIDDLCPPDPRRLERGDSFYDAVAPASFPRRILHHGNRRWAERVGVGGLTAPEWERHFARLGVDASRCFACSRRERAPLREERSPGRSPALCPGEPLPPSTRPLPALARRRDQGASALLERCAQRLERCARHGVREIAGALEQPGEPLPAALVRAVTVHAAARCAGYARAGSSMAC
ncbi:uncharacterized protein SOCEGT47_061910 [Sorangium cellulosum]|uniref:Uncharacterized protein n=1 Tax=Sorangium cellulosum TaxID=56 RepID=A0A4V0NEC0_SORCE|nr:uncharacterized protein SOCEGT47_061910 [Sorangium cellulosum]